MEGFLIILFIHCKNLKNSDAEMIAQNALDELT